MQEFQDLLTKLNSMRSRYHRVTELLSYEEVVLDNRLCLKLDAEKRKLQPIVEQYEKYLQLVDDLGEYTKLNDLSQEDNDLVEKEIVDIENKINNIQSSILNTINNSDAKWDNIVIEIVFKSDNILGKDIFNGYLNYIKSNNYEHAVSQLKDGQKIIVEGFNLKNIFNKEIGLHVDSFGGSVQVYVYDNIVSAIQFDDKDVVVTTFRSSGAGGQHINTTDSAIRAVHLPTGISTTCQSERSQFQNKRLALDSLKEKVESHLEQQKTNNIITLKKEQVKLIKNKHIAKIYNYDSGVVVSKDKKEIKLKDFLMGQAI